MDPSIKNTLFDILVDNHRSSPILFSILSGILASIGLGTNSYSTIIGSMLLSPIGNLINVKNIYDILKEANVPMKRKYQNWIISLLFVIIIVIGIGYLIGTIFRLVKNPFTNEALTKEWPTKEMKERANPMNVIYLVFIALTCSIALPLSILMNNPIRAVAIGIATALVPPLANIGLSLSMKRDTPEQQDYVYSAIRTGTMIFLVNFLILWLPSKYLLKIIIQKRNIFKTIENTFVLN
jgi:uncharacterized membrane protein